MICELIPGVFFIQGDYHAPDVVANGRLDGDRPFLEYVLPFVIPGTIVLDVGANIGSHSLAYLNKGAVVHAFEPNPEAFECLNLNCPGIISHNVAVGDKITSVTLWINAEESSMSFITCPGHLSGGICKEEIAVPMVTLDHVYQCHKEDWDRLGVSYIKIDVEGSEPLVLMGAKETIRKFKPKMVIEVCYNTLGRLLRVESSILSQLEDLGYDWSKIPCASPFPDDRIFYYNLLATPKDVI